MNTPVRLGVSPSAASIPTGVFCQRLGGFISRTGSLGCAVYNAPQLFLPVYLHSNVGPPSPPATASPTQSSSRYLAMCPLHTGCPSPPLLQVWINLSSVIPWLSDFHTVQFSGSSAYYLLLNLLWSFFWLYEEAKYIYLCLHPGQKLRLF